ncbi:hypothetical protein K4K52_007982 [Colletotrichum sp. SAR 10_76]|nr:hypothetical protein K4K51_007842 [Colletotrichum sp. SAR 10_75]KAI8200497.1 hypothetical protein K4K52_007982 [Colletotrichum sp. SAR 10_76]
MEDPKATANLPSILPQRWPAVRDLLGELDQCLNHLAAGPGPNITDIYPRLHEQFWRAAYAINRHQSQSDSDSSSRSNNRDVREWPAFMRERIPDLRLQATLFPIFAPSYNTIKLNPKHAQRINKACQDLACTVYDLFLDFSTEVANSTHALQAISSLFYRHPEVTRDALVSAVQAEMLSRPSLTPDTPPTPTVSEVTKAIKILPANTAQTSTVAASREMPPRASRKRAAEAITDVASSSKGPAAKKRKVAIRRTDKDMDADDDDDDDDEEDELGPADQSSQIPSAEEPRGDGNTIFGADQSLQSFSELSSAVRTPETVRRERAAPGLLPQVLRNHLRSAANIEHPRRSASGDPGEDKTAECLALCRQLLAVSDGGEPRIGNDLLRGSLYTVFAAARVAVELEDQNQDGSGSQ